MLESEKERKGILGGIEYVFGELVTEHEIIRDGEFAFLTLKGEGGINRVYKITVLFD